MKLHDADWASSVEDRNSTSGCWFSLGSTSISWTSRKQKSIALSTAEALYIATSMTSCVKLPGCGSSSVSCLDTCWMPS